MEVVYVGACYRRLVVEEREGVASRNMEMRMTKTVEETVFGSELGREGSCCQNQS